jgi:1-acyl-sn-glycerol-3-phosphate acyltransferase
MKFWTGLRVFLNSRSWAHQSDLSLDWDPSQQDFGRILSFWGEDVVREGRLRVVARGLNRLEQGAAYLFAPTHNSSIEIPLLFMALEPWMPGFLSHIRYKSFLIGNLILGLKRPMERAGRFVFVDRHKTESKKAAGEEVIRLLKRPNNRFSMVIFPQGTRALCRKDESGNRIDGDLFAKGPLDEGVAIILRRLALRGVKLVPIVINGAGEAFPKGFAKKAKVGGEIELIVGEPKSADEICGNLPSNRMTQKIMSYIAGFYLAYYKSPLPSQLFQSP